MTIFRDLLFFVIPGNHDLPAHNLENLGRSSLGVLDAARAVSLLGGGKPHYLNETVSLYGFGWNEDIILPERTPGEFRIVMSHQMVLNTPMSFGGVMADKLIESVDADLILTGDNHERFTREKDGRLLVNPGCFTRQTVNQMDEVPGFYVFDTDTKKLDFIEIPHERGVISDDHLLNKEEREDRIAAFVERMNVDYEVGMSFMKNMQAYFDKNVVDQEVKDLIWEVLE